MWSSMSCIATLESSSKSSNGLLLLVIGCLVLGLVVVLDSVVLVCDEIPRERRLGRLPVSVLESESELELESEVRWIKLGGCSKGVLIAKEGGEVDSESRLSVVSCRGRVSCDIPLLFVW